MADLLCMGEPMLEFNQLPPQPDGAVHYLEGHGGDTSNAAVAAARHGASVGYITAIGQDAPGDSFIAMWVREKVDSSTVIRTDRAQTGVYFVTHDAAGPPLPALPHELAGGAVCGGRPAAGGDRGGEDVLRVGHQPGHFHIGGRRGVRRDRHRAGAWGEGRLRHQLPAAAVAAGARGGGDACGDRPGGLRVSRHGGRAGADRPDRSGRDPGLLPGARLPCAWC